MKLDDSLQLVLILMAIASGFYRLVKLETAIHSKIERLQSDFNVYVAKNCGDLTLVKRDVSYILEKLDS